MATTCDGIADRMEGRDGQHQRWFTHCLRPEDGFLAVRRLVAPHVSYGRPVARGRNLVRRGCVRLELTLLVPPQLFGREPAITLQVPALDLPEIDGRVQRLAHVVEYVDPQQSRLAGERIERYFA